MNENELKELSEKLKEEASEYYKLAKEYRRCSVMRDKTENFLLNRNWLAKWKKYVDYQSIKDSQKSYYSYYSYNKREYKIDPESIPGEIDNNSLLYPLDEFLNDGDPHNEDNFVVRHDINAKTDLKIVNKNIWQFFYERYGGGPQIEKPLIDNNNSYSSSKVVEVFLRKLQIITLPDRKNMTKESLSQLKPELIFISRIVYLESLKEKIVDLKKLKNFYDGKATTNNLRLFKLQNISWEEAVKSITENSDLIRNSQTFVKYDKILFLEDIPNQKLDEVDIADTDYCIVEYFEDENSKLFEVEKKIIKQGVCEYCNKMQYLRYVCACKEVAYCTSRCLQNDKNYHKNRCKKANEEEENALVKSTNSRGGLVGLQNLGNTCFMNTSLQCLSNCYELTDYFLRDLFKKDINKDNPIGTGGDLASAYAVLLKNLWYGSSNVYSPWAFKRAIGGFQSMFSGYMQHDTQEFLNYLLDGLHEDLNRVFKKPMVEKDDSKKNDEIKSKESWIGFLRRNQSLLVDLFYGQFKSTLYCPDDKCQNISTCFDPYLSISLPLVSRTEPYGLTCYFIFHDMSIKPLELEVQFSTETTIMAFRNKVSKMLKIHPFSFFIVKLENLSTVDCFLNSQNLLKPPSYSSYSSNRGQKYFLFQIDPALFYNPNLNKLVNCSTQCVNGSKVQSWLQNAQRNFRETKVEIEKEKEFLNQLFDVYYEEDEHGGTQEAESYYSKKMNKGIFKINLDDNYGFNDDWLKVVVYIKSYDNNYNTTRRNSATFPRIIYLSKNWSLKYIHQYVFSYVTHLIKLTNPEVKDLENSVLYEKFYQKINESNEISDKIDIQKEQGIPYRLRVYNHNAFRNDYSRYDIKNCYFCSNDSCQGCLIPYSDDITLREYISKIPNSELGREIDNNYFFMHERYKHFIGTGNRDFSLELSFLEEYVPAIKTLLEKENIDFKIQQHERPDGIDIIECFKNFIKLEKLEDNNEWYCPDCKNHVKATKKMEIYNSPNIMIVHLKRFKNTTKIDTLVKFPLESLDISDFVINKSKEEKFIYDCFAVANHFGSMGFGHYTAYAKNYFTDKWYDFDDSHVSEINGKDVITPSAYVLFYRKRNVKDIVDLNSLYNKNFVNYEEINDNGPNIQNNLQRNTNNDNNGIKNNNINPAISSNEALMDIDPQLENRPAMEIDYPAEEEKSKKENFIDLSKNQRK